MSVIKIKTVCITLLIYTFFLTSSGNAEELSNAAREKRKHDIKVYGTIRMANELYQVGNSLGALNSLELLEERVPNRFDVCGSLFAYKDKHFKLEDYGSMSTIQKDITQASQIQKDTIQANKKLGKQCIARFMALNADMQNIYTEMFLFLLGGLVDYAEYEIPVKYFNQYYGASINMPHPAKKYLVIHYATALAKTGDYDKGNTLFLQTIDTHPKDQFFKILYIRYLSENKTPRDGVNYATNYLDKAGFYDGIHHELCLTYSKEKLLGKAKVCFTELLNIAKVKSVAPEYISSAERYLKDTHG